MMARLTWVLTCALATTLMVGANLSAQSGKPKEKSTTESSAKDSAKESKDDSKSSKSDDEKTGRMPIGWGRIKDLSDKQKDEIRAIDLKHAAKIKKLEADLAAAKKAKTDEQEAVLTSAQRTELTKLQEADREKAAKARKAKSENKKA